MANEETKKVKAPEETKKKPVPEKELDKVVGGRTMTLRGGRR